MDVVTITDHDAIDGCLEFLDRHADADDFFISEEVGCRVPDVPLKVHVAAYGIDERMHREVQSLRANVYEVAAYLRAEHVCFALNHPFFFFRRQMPVGDYLRALFPLFPAVEVRNGAMIEPHNALIASILQATVGSGATDVAALGGSDAHTLRSIGTTYTEAPGRNVGEFLDSLRAGRARPGGRHGTVGRIAHEIYGVIACYVASLAGKGRQDLSWGRRAPALLFSAVSLPFEFVPLVIAIAQKADEARRIDAFAREWAALLEEQSSSKPRAIDVVSPILELDTSA